MRTLLAAAALTAAATVTALVATAGPSNADPITDRGPLICVTPGPVTVRDVTVTPPPVCVL